MVARNLCIAALIALATPAWADNSHPLFFHTGESPEHLAVMKHLRAHLETANRRLVFTAKTVYDRQTQLTWERWERQKNWYDARRYCTRLRLGSFSSGWRLPTLKELQFMFTYESQLLWENKGKLPASGDWIGPSPEPNLFWTAKTDADDAGSAWSINYGEGYPMTANKTDENSVRCVHSSTQ